MELDRVQRYFPENPIDLFLGLVHENPDQGNASSDPIGQLHRGFEIHVPSAGGHEIQPDLVNTDAKAGVDPFKIGDSTHFDQDRDDSPLAIAALDESNLPSESLHWGSEQIQ